MNDFRRESRPCSSGPDIGMIADAALSSVVLRRSTGALLRSAIAHGLEGGAR